jgi:2,3-bisphosphoglycerate-independent phosphoglycerate mutase
VPRGRRGAPRLTHGGTETGTSYDIDFDRLAAAFKPAVDAIAAQSRCYDADRLATGIRPAVGTLALKRGSG